MRGGHGGGRKVATDTAQDTSKALGKLLRFMWQYKFRIFIVMILGVVISGLQVVSPFVLGRATDTIIKAIGGTLEGNFLETITKIIIILLGSYLLSSLLNYMQTLILSATSQKLVYDLRKDIQHKLKFLPLKYYDGTELGDILSRVTNDVDTMSNGLLDSLPNLLSSVLTLIFVLIGMISVSPKLTIIGLVMIPVSALTSVLLVKGSQKYFVGQQKGLGNIGGYIEEMFSGHEVIRAYNQEENTIEKFEVLNEDLYVNSRRAQFVSGLIFPLSAFFSNLGYVAVVILGGLVVFREPARLSVGNLQTFTQLLRQFNQPIAQLSNMVSEFQSTVAAAERIFGFLEEDEEPKNPVNPQTIDNPKGQVSIQHINFGYSDDNIIINDLNISFKAGDKIAIVGPTGAGKTTLVNLLLRFYDVQEGKILIDGVDITQMDREYLRSLFGMVLQDTWLFDGTIMENIRYGRLDATDEEVKQAAKNAYVDDFIRTLPDGYNMMLEEGGANISGGQRQLITIARAILSNPVILVLDEATSSVDTRTEKRIQNAMENLMEGRTSFVIAHRLSTIRDSETILVLNEGEIVETGNHDELLALDGFYSQLYHSQLTGGSNSIN